MPALLFLSDTFFGIEATECPADEAWSYPSEAGIGAVPTLPAKIELLGSFGQLFIDLAIRAAGRATGGAAKAAIIGSSLMGSISALAVANVVSTGDFAIPLIKRTGLPAHRG